MSDGAANEARVVITCDFDTMRDFIEFTKKGLIDVEKQGKSAFGEVGKSVTDFTRSTLQGALMGVGMQLFDAVVSPLKKGFGELIADAAKLRQAVTQTAIAAGEDFKKFEDRLNDLRKKTGEGVDPIKNYVRDVASRNGGDWDKAFRSVEGAKKEAIARGYGSVSEMSAESGELQNRYKIEDTEKFFNEQRSRAKALGLNENVAAETSRRMREQYKDVGMSAEGVGRFSNALLKASGGDMQMALKAGQEFSGLVQGPESRGYLEKTLGLKQGALLDERGRPDVARAIDLMEKFQLKHRGQKGLEFVARQHMSPTSADLFSRRMEEVTSAADAQRYVEPGTPLQGAAGRFFGSKQGKSERAAQGRAIADEQAGKSWLEYKERVADVVGGGGPTKWLNLATPTGVRTVLGENREDLEKHYAAGRERDRVAREAMAKRKAEEEARGAPTFWRPTGSAESIPLGGPAPGVSLGLGLTGDPRQVADEQAKRNAEALRTGAPVPIRGLVQIEMVPPASVGRGGQH